MDWYPNQSAITFFIGQIWPALRAIYPDGRLTVVGKNPPSFLVKLAKKEQGLTVTGWVRDVRPYIEETEVYICPIKDGGGTPLKILDAMAMGKAVISTSFACNGIDVSPGTNIMIADTPSEFLHQIKTVFNNYNFRSSLGIEARRLMTGKYSWDVIGNKLCHLYEGFDGVSNSRVA